MYANGKFPAGNFQKRHKLEVTKVNISQTDHLHSESQYLAFSDDEILKGWELVDPYFQYEGKELLKVDHYKSEPEHKLVQRCTSGKTNFPNIGGNPSTRITEDDESFVEANRITPYFIATGYPTFGIMRENYWKMVSTLQKTHTVFIVNFMSEADVKGYGGWFFKPFDMKGRKFLVSILNHNDQPIYFYHYPFWKDHGEGDRKVVAEIIRQMYEATTSLKAPLIIANCRAGVGRTGTFANLFHFYKKMKEDMTLRKEDFSIKAIIENIRNFRGERGDQQFVQSKAQFIMLCRMVEFFFNEEIDKRAG